MQKEYFSLNAVKAFACTGVILMHCGFPGIFGKIVIYLSKFSVPVFFMISGFFLYSNETDVIRKRLRKRIPKIGCLLFAALILYGG